MKKFDHWLHIAILLFFIGGLAVWNLLSPDRVFSPIENRNLQQAPTFSLSSLFAGDFTRDYESYVTDQFPLRDAWTGLKAYVERIAGKRENNGVYILGDTLIERFSLSDGGAQFESNLRSVDALAEALSVPVYLMLIPTTAEIWQDRLPQGAPGTDQEALLESIQTSAIYVDALTSLQAHRDEPIYYRTDHHWTSLGALYGANALRQAMGMSAIAPDMWSPETVSTEFYGTLWSTSGARYIAPDTIEIYVPDAGVTVTSHENGEAKAGMLYDRSRLQTKDKYSLFLGGNQPLAVIDTENEAGENLLIIRDSYADSEVPFLLDGAGEIHLMDLRYYRQSIAEYVQEHAIDRVIISYSLKNFATDQNVYFLRPR